MIYRVISKERFLYVDGLLQWKSKRDCVFYSSDGGNSWILFARLKPHLILSLLSRVALSARLFRLHVDHLCIVKDKVVIFGMKRIFVYNSQGKLLSTQPLIGSRPLSICMKKNFIYYGEYCSNPERSEVRIFRSKDCGLTWEIAYALQGVRHVHGIFNDPYENAIWVTTGDNDEESTIWHTADDFETLERVIGGSQQTRAIQLLFTDEYIYFGTDTPIEPNYIYRMRRGKYIPKKLVRVGSSVFFGSKIGDILVFSTSVEPTTVNRTDACELWLSHDGSSWKKIVELKKDILSMKYFQYGQIFFPAGPGDGKQLLFSPFCTQYSQYTLTSPVQYTY